MDDSISKLLATMQKPARRWKQLTVKVTDREFMQLESFCAVRYLSYSDVLREALNQYLNTIPTDTQ